MIFVEELRRFAAQSRDPRLAPIIRCAGEPVRIAVHGRSGVGRRTVEAVLADTGVATVGRPDVADVNVVVIAETVKPEDHALLATAGPPALVVLNKADLTRIPDAAALRTLAGVSCVPMVGLLARVDLDAEMLAALRRFGAEPADLTSTDAFVDGPHTVSRAVRERLLERLDRFGIIQAVQALATGLHAGALPVLLRRLSGVEDVVAHLDVVSAPVRYRRVHAALAELRALAVGPDERLTQFLGADDTVIAVMAAAVEVVEAAGLAVDRGDDPAAHLRRALRWRRYSRGPVSALHRRCGADISRGSLRLLARAHRATGGIR